VSKSCPSILAKACVLLWFPAVIAVGDPPPPARIQLLSAVPLREIPPTLFGVNTEWIWNENLLWDQAANAPGAAYQAYLQDLKPSVFRFPGGFFADYYDWRNGTGPQQTRPITEILPNGAYSAHVFGTPEALELARLTGGELLVTVNAGSGTAAMAADWVRYINLQSQGPAVRFWEIGNELYLPVSSLDGMTLIALPAQEYARRVVEFATAMKTVDPSIQIGAILDETLGGASNSSWTRTLLEIAGAHIDFVAVHNSYAPVLASGGDRPVRTVYSSMAAAPVLIARNLDSLARRLDEAIPAKAGKIKIAVTEWGPFFHFDPGHRYFDHVKTMGSALFTAGTLMAFIRSPRTEIANFFKLNDFLNSGLIGFRGDTPAATSSFFAFQMFTRRLGRALLPTRIESPAFQTDAVGTIPALSNVAYLDAVSTISADRSTLFLTVVNRNFDTSLVAEVDLGPFSVTTDEARSHILSATALDAHTGTAPWPATGVRVGSQATDEPVSRFHDGGPGEVRILVSPLQISGSLFQFEFPPCSVTTLEIPVAAP